MATTEVRSNPQEPEHTKSDLATLLSDVQRLQDEVATARDVVRAGQRAATISLKEAEAEFARLRALGSDIESLEAKLRSEVQVSDNEASTEAPSEILSLVQADLKEANGLRTAAEDLQRRLKSTADQMANRALNELHREMKQVLDKAKLGKIDAVIGQKRKLEIEVQDLAAGRFPPELHGKLWEEGLIEDDEEYWPFEGEFWSDEYSGWR